MTNRPARLPTYALILAAWTALVAVGVGVGAAWWMQ